jgi:hypothetical protein
MHVREVFKANRNSKLFSPARILGRVLSSDDGLEGDEPRKKLTVVSTSGTKREVIGAVNKEAQIILCAGGSLICFDHIDFEEVYRSESLEQTPSDCGVARDIFAAALSTKGAIIGCNSDSARSALRSFIGFADSAGFMPDTRLLVHSNSIQFVHYEIGIRVELLRLWQSSLDQVIKEIRNH